MSVWKRFQRVGKKAAKFQFTASYTELIIETNSFKPSNVVITWMRRNRKHHSKNIKLNEVKPKSSSYSYVWEVPHNEEIVTTLYKIKKEHDYEEKDWTFQLEDVGDNGTRRRLLAYRNVNMAQYAAILPTQNNIKINFKISSKKIQSATLFLTLSGVFLREGDATDDDMISVASLMSLPSNQNFSSTQSSDIARLSDFDDFSSETSNNINEKFNDLFDKIGNLESQVWNVDELPASESEKFPQPIKEKSPARKEWSPVKESSPDLFCPRISKLRVDSSDDRLSNIAEEDRTPVPESSSTSDLLDWCKFITSGYSNVSITNFTTSFRNGIAFCAIIHHFHPDLIDFESLKPTNVKENNRIAFSAAARLGITKVLDPNEMNFLKVPDKLSVMTYLHQLRTHFTDSNLVITAASFTDDADQHSSYTMQATPHSSSTPVDSSNQHVASVGDADNKIEVNHPGSEFQPSTNGDGQAQKPPTPSEAKPVSFEHLPSEPEVQSKKKSPKKPKLKLSSLNVDGSAKESGSWSERRKIKKVSLGPLSLLSEPAEPSPGPGSHAQGSQSQQSPPHPQEPSVSSSSYISAETAALEREQIKIDEEASRLEPRLRQAMERDKQQPSDLMEQWFVLVNKKNALIRRNMQLQILDKEQDLKKKWELLQVELRQINAIEDWNKSEAVRRREELLMKDLVVIIDQRDKVIRDLDDYEKGIATDIEWAKMHPSEIAPGNGRSSKSLANLRLSEKNCVVQ